MNRRMSLGTDLEGGTVPSGGARVVRAVVAGVLLSACGIATDRPVAAQESAVAEIPPGTYLRVSGASFGAAQIKGESVSLGNGILILHAGAGKPDLRIDLASVSAVERRTARGWRGETIGLLAVAGAVGGLATARVCKNAGAPAAGSSLMRDGFQLNVTDKALCYGFRMALGGSAGALLGMVLSRADRWEDVPLERVRQARITHKSIRWQVAVGGGALGASLSLGF
jgi:hypothetical protein